MSLTGGIVTFVIAWWMVFFMALPFGAAPEEEPQPGHDRGAPANPRLLVKALVATVLAGLITYAIAAVIDSGLIQMRGSGAPF